MGRAHGGAGRDLEIRGGGYVMMNRAAVALVLVLSLGVPLVGQVCATQSYLVSRETAVTAQTAIVQTIDGASRSLDVAVSSLVDSVIADAIVRALGRGVAVRVILPAAARSEGGGQYSKLLDAGAPLKLSPTPLAGRTAVIDGATVITGSYEWAGGTAQTSYGTLTVIRCALSASGSRESDPFVADFNRLWNRLAGPAAASSSSATASVSMSVLIQEVDCDNQCILLFNSSVEAAGIGGWVLTDSEGQYVFPADSVLSPGEMYRLCVGTLNPADVFLFFLDPDHDELYLVAPDGTLVDQEIW